MFCVVPAFVVSRRSTWAGGQGGGSGSNPHRLFRNRWPFTRSVECSVPPTSTLISNAHCWLAPAARRGWPRCGPCGSLARKRRVQVTGGGEALADGTQGGVPFEILTPSACT